MKKISFICREFVHVVLGYSFLFLIGGGSIYYYLSHSINLRAQQEAIQNTRILAKKISDILTFSQNLSHQITQFSPDLRHPASLKTFMLYVLAMIKQNKPINGVTITQENFLIKVKEKINPQDERVEYQVTVQDGRASKIYLFDTHFILKEEHQEKVGSSLIHSTVLSSLNNQIVVSFKRPAILSSCFPILTEQQKIGAIQVDIDLQDLCLLLNQEGHEHHFHRYLIKDNQILASNNFNNHSQNYLKIFSPLDTLEMIKQELQENENFSFINSANIITAQKVPGIISKQKLHVISIASLDQITQELNIIFLRFLFIGMLLLIFLLIWHVRRWKEISKDLNTLAHLFNSQITNSHINRLILSPLIEIYELAKNIKEWGILEKKKTSFQNDAWGWVNAYSSQKRGYILCAYLIEHKTEAHHTFVDILGEASLTFQGHILELTPHKVLICWPEEKSDYFKQAVIHLLKELKYLELSMAMAVEEGLLEVEICGHYKRTLIIKGSAYKKVKDLCEFATQNRVFLCSPSRLSSFFESQLQRLLRDDSIEISWFDVFETSALARGAQEFFKRFRQTYTLFENGEYEAAAKEFKHLEQENLTTYAYPDLMCTRLAYEAHLKSV